MCIPVHYTALLGISSAPGFFQENDGKLRAEYSTCHFMHSWHNFVISGENNDNLMQNLEVEVKKLSTAGVRLRGDNSFVKVLQVIYFDHVINGSGIKPVVWGGSHTYRIIRHLKMLLSCTHSWEWWTIIFVSYQIQISVQPENHYTNCLDMVNGMVISVMWIMKLYMMV